MASRSEPIPFPWDLEIPPGEDELLTEDGEPMESARHRQQGNLLLETLNLLWQGRDDFYAGGSMFLYFSETQVKKNQFRGPDFFLVLRTTRRERKAWVLWKEDGQAPDLVVELLSPSTEAMDRGPKMRVYEQLLRVPDYILYDPWTGTLEAYRLLHGSYAPLQPDADGRLSLPQLGLSLAIWHGIYQMIEAPWLRWYTMEGELLPTEAEARLQVEQRAAAESQRAAAESQRAAAEIRARIEAEERARALEQRLAELERLLGRG